MFENKYHINFIFVCFFGMGLLSADFEVKELDLEDESEINSVSALFDDSENRLQTLVDSEEIRRMIPSKDNKIFICKARSMPSVVIGILICKYGRNVLAFNGYDSYLNWDFLTPKYKKTEFDAICYSTIAVHHNYRRQGVASALMQRAQQLNIDFDVEDITVSVFSSNEKAIECYKKQGFKEIKQGCSTKTLHKKLQITKKDESIDQHLLYVLSPFHE